MTNTKAPNKDKLISKYQGIVYAPEEDTEEDIEQMIEYYNSLNYYDDIPPIGGFHDW